MTTVKEAVKKIRENLGKGKVMVIGNEHDNPMIAMSAEPGSGIERFLDLLEKSTWECPNKEPHACMPITIVERAKIIVLPVNGSAIAFPTVEPIQ